MVTEEASNVIPVIKDQEISEDITQNVVPPVVEEVKGVEDLVNIANSLADLADLSSMISSDTAPSIIPQSTIDQSTTLVSSNLQQ